MAGIPPLAGFVGKLLILNIVIDNNLFFLAIIAVITSVISAFYYIRLVKSMFFDSPKDDLDLHKRILNLNYYYQFLDYLIYQ